MVSESIPMVIVSCNSMMMRGQLFHIRLLLLIMGKKCSEKIYKTLKFSWIAHLVNLKINFIFIYIGHNLPQLFPHYHVTWNYSATIHAKGDASGLGGTLVALLGLLCRTVGLTGIRIPSWTYSNNYFTIFCQSSVIILLVLFEF